MQPTLVPPLALDLPRLDLATLTPTALVYACVAAYLVGSVLQPCVLRFMTSASVLDIPSERSSHTTPTPRGGGVAVTLAFLVGALLVPAARPLTIPVFVFAAIGLNEDLRGVPVVLRFATQLVAGAGTALVLMPATAEGVVDLTGLDLAGLDVGAVETGSVQARVIQLAIVVIGALWMTAFVNAFNFMDGVNGISAMSAIAAGAIYTVVGGREGLPLLTATGALIAIAAVTFLPWNAPRARIFLGDVGSYGLGAALGALAGYAVLHGVAVELAIAPLALYLVDTGWTLLRRMTRGQQWLRPHRTHVYQRLTDVGWSHIRVALTTAALAGALSVCAFVAVDSDPPARIGIDAVGVALLVAYVAAPGYLRARRRAQPVPQPERQELYV